MANFDVVIAMSQREGVNAMQRLNSPGSTAGKVFRWHLEKQFGTRAIGQTVSRNLLLNERVEVFENRSATTTDILQEYFVPPSSSNSFLSGFAALFRLIELTCSM